MELKKLGFMNIKREDILSRSEMKGIMAGSGDDNSQCTPGGKCYCRYNGACIHGCEYGPFYGAYYCSICCVDGGWA